MTDKFDAYRPNVGVTAVPLILKDNKVQVLTYVRPDDAETFASKIALPNGFMNITKHTTLEDAAMDALLEKTGAKVARLEQFHVFSGDYIDPTRRITLNVPFLAMHKVNEISFVDGDDTPSINHAQWMPIEEALSLTESDFAFNHYQVLSSSIEQIRKPGNEVRSAIDLLPEQFTIPELMEAYKSITGTDINENRLRKKIRDTNFIIDSGEKRRIKGIRPATLYTNNPKYVEPIVFN
ncbi:NUDIX hydrolase [Vibrio parahaemolyticus]|uniref:NUDIX hydrolase n=1 Tax=Vibrio parahaemolyticus TaxID=670 RepID=UPI00387A92A9